MALFGKKKPADNPFGNMQMPPMGAPEENPMQDMGQAPDPYGQQYYPQGANDAQQMPPDMNSMQDMNQMPPPDMGQMQQEMPQDYPQGYGQQYAQPTFPSQQFSQPFPQSDATKERIEEIAEAIIDEKWNELIRDINKVIEWKERTDGDIKKIQQEIENLKERFDSLHQGILGKISEYDQNLSNVGTEIKAMEMTFQKILPTFTENVSKLDRLVKNAGAK